MILDEKKEGYAERAWVRVRTEVWRSYDKREEALGPDSVSALGESGVAERGRFRKEVERKRLNPE